MSNTPQTEAQRIADGLLAETSKFGTPSIQRGLLNGAIQELRRLDAIEQRYNEMMASPCPEWDNKAYMQAIANLRAQLAKAVAEEREACAKACDEFMRLTLDAQLGEPSDLHNVMLRQIANLGHSELAGAIRARSNT